MRYPIDELIDKRSIIQLKIERIGNKEDRERLKEEQKAYSKAINVYIKDRICSEEEAQSWHDRLYEANGKTWDLETDIRKGQTGDMSLEDVGRAAIAIRESNGVRVAIKSEITTLTGIGYRDIKINHASQKTYERY
jgi:FtsZ-binding cell division protein ZapB